MVDKPKSFINNNDGKHIDIIKNSRWSKFGKKGKLSGSQISSIIDNFYMTCTVSRSSQTMAACINENRVAAE